MSLKDWLNVSSAVFRREMLRICNSPAEIVLCWIMPLIWMLIIWGLVGTGLMQDLPVAFVDNDHSKISRQIGFDLDSIRTIRPISYSNTAEGMEALKSGKVYAMLVIPKDYSRDLTSGVGQSLVLYLDQTRYSIAGSIRGDITEYLKHFLKENIKQSSYLAGGGVSVAERRLDVLKEDFFSIGNPAFSFLPFLGSTLLPGLLQLAAALGFAACLIRESYNGTVANWLATARGSVSAALFGKILPCYFFYCLLFFWYLALFLGQGGIQFNGSLLIWSLAGFLLIAGMAAAVIFFYSIAISWRLLLVLVSGYAAPALPFSGFSIPLDSMGPAVAAFAKILPITWFIRIQEQQWILGANFSQCALHFLFLILLVAIPGTLGYWILQARLRRIPLQKLNNFEGDIE